MLRPRAYVRDVTLRPDAWPGYEPQNGPDRRGLLPGVQPAVVRGPADDRRRDQVQHRPGGEAGAGDDGRARRRRRRGSGRKIEVPQVAQFRFHERFRWPVDQVLLVGMGMVPLPVPVDSQVDRWAACRCRCPPRPPGPICW